MRRVRIPLIAVLAAVAGPPIAHAAGFQNYFHQSTAALAQAGAVVARCDEPSAVFYNPAAITWLPGTQCHAVVNVVAPHALYRPAAGSESPLELEPTEMVSAGVPVPALHLTQYAGGRVTVGFGLNTPYGSRSEWAPDWCGRYYAGFTNLKSIYAAPTAAVRLTDGLSLGGAFLVVRSEAIIERSLNAPLIFASAIPGRASDFASGAFSTVNDISTHLAGDGWGYGMRLGAHWIASARCALGAAFQSRVGVDLKGRATYQIPSYEDVAFGRAPGAGALANELAESLFPASDIETHIEFPATLAAGMAFWVAEDWIVEADATWTGWSSYDTLRVSYENLAGVSHAETLTPKNWRDVWALRLGSEWRLSDQFLGRLGYAFDQSPVPNETRDPSLPGGDRHDFACGLGYRTALWGLDASYMYILIDDSVSEQDVTLNGDLSGDYETSAQVFSLAVSVRL